MENKMNTLDLTFYGDDFTGSTDVIEALALAHVPVALFTEPPTQAQIHDFQFKNTLFSKQKLRAVGVAGISRSLNNEQMQATLPPIFEKLAALNAKFFHYKVCSTFDSSPSIGSIGQATDIASEYFESELIPLLVGMPKLNRFVVFGNLFARVQETTYRLDRHPTMSKHPITPMDESDILLHLSKQTKKEGFLIDVLQLEDRQKNLKQLLDKAKSAGKKIVLFDTLSPTHLNLIGEELKTYFTTSNQLIVGSSAVATALFPEKENEAQRTKTSLGKAQKMIAMSGSCSPVAAEQILYAQQIGFKTIAIDIIRLLNEQESASEQERLMRLASESKNEYSPIIFYSALGPNDPSLPLVKQIPHGQERLPILLGKLLKDLVLRYKPDRVISAGGDTSGKITRLLEIDALEFLAELTAGSPFCLTHAQRKEFDNLQIALKGGQNGKKSFYQEAYEGVKY
ncbi:MAG: four-carbon acid sugar kinase family protein [Thermoflexibacter sp.]